MPVLAGARGAPRRPAAWRRLVGAALLLAVAGCTAQPPGRAATPGAGGATTSTATPITPRLLAGVPLTGPTGLELVVSGNPPRLLDLDAGTSRKVAGVPGGPDRVAWVQPVGRDAVIVSEAVPAAGQVFRLRRGAATATPVGRATDAIASRDGRRLASWPVVHAVAGDLVLWGGEELDQGPFTLTDRRSGARQRIPRPSRVGQAGGGLPSPDGRLLAVEFSDPAWDGGPAQLMDVWLLDLRTRRWSQLPGMPVLVALKFTSMAWTEDGSLLLLGSFDRVGDALAQWRPGQAQLAIRRLQLPADRAGSDSFVPRPRAPR